MRPFILVSWLLIAVAAVAWHYGPGQDQMHLDDAARAVAQAQTHVAGQEWAEAIASYDQALAYLPPEKIAAARTIRVERSKAQMLNRQLPAAHSDLSSLVDELKDDPKADAKTLREARSALANSQYYMTWLMRLEGLPRDAWEPEAEAARQGYRLLAEQADAAGDMAAAKRNRDDLESAIRLARMDLGELQGLPLPSQ